LNNCKDDECKIKKEYEKYKRVIDALLKGQITGKSKIFDNWITFQTTKPDEWPKHVIKYAVQEALEFVNIEERINETNRCKN
jgi:hypothetical protein